MHFKDKINKQNDTKINVKTFTEKVFLKKEIKMTSLERGNLKSMTF